MFTMVECMALSNPRAFIQVNTKLCLSLSDFHPESWNPMWSVSSILVGLQSFMGESHATSGSMTSTYAGKRTFAAQSLDYNCRNRYYFALFIYFVLFVLFCLEDDFIFDVVYLFL
jgi:ubiquitin-conjugating enzyme E2 J2